MICVSAGAIGGSILPFGLTEGDLLSSSRHSVATYSDASSDDEYVAVRGVMAPEENAGVGRDTGASLHSGHRETVTSPTRKRAPPKNTRSPDAAMNRKN